MSDKANNERTPGAATPGAGETSTRARISFTQDTTPEPRFCQSTSTTAQTWRDRKARADEYWPAVAALLAGLGFENATPAPLWQDRQGVDILTAGGARLAWRNRAARFLAYRDITLRLAKPSGRRTEVDKLARGSADYAIWTWTSGRTICAWLLLSVPAMQPLLRQDWARTEMPDATFCAIPWRDLWAAGAIRAASRNVWMMIT
jgi:hypothetical protein